jgi:hypothetical protein
MDILIKLINHLPLTIEKKKKNKKKKRWWGGVRYTERWIPQNANI